MRYASVCSGIEAASLAWEPLGWEPARFAQFDPEHNYKNGPDFPSAVLAARWPHVPNLGDMTKIRDQEVFKNEPFDLLVGGTPCQSFSIAGLRKGVDDSRGQLTLEFVKILRDKQPQWFVWENVPGVLSSNKGADFASLLGALHEVGYSFCWRILDAQYCGVPQRRRRVFIVGYLGGDWRPPAAVLFERQSMPGYFKPSNETEQEVAKCLRARAHSSHREDSDNFVVHGTQDPCVSDIAFALGRNNGGENVLVKNGSHWDDRCNPHPTLNQSHNTGGIAMSNQEIFAQRGAGLVKTYVPKTAHCLQTTCNDYSRADGFNMFTQGNAVRHLTEVEGERLQGMPDHHTNIMWKGKPAPSGQRYKAVGNSMARPAMHWIGKRIDFVDGVLNDLRS